MKTVSIEALLAKYPNEDAHTEHVARLALELFDGTRTALNGRAADRAILAAAARLHDVGYARAPAAHALAGARIALAEPIAGLRPVQRRYVAAVILLHPARSGERALTHRLVTGLPEPERAIRLAAVLQVAEGLDHGHVQNAQIRSIRVKGAVCRVFVRSEGYRHNVAWANRRAALWRRVFPLGIDIVGAPPDLTAPRFQGIVHRRDSVLGAARRVLHLKYRVVSDNRGGAVAGDSPEHLHDIRVAVRRFRAALRVFRKPLKPTSAPDLNRALARLADRLGPVRDSDVWVAFLESVSARRRVPDTPAWRAYGTRQRALGRRNQTRLRRLLRSAEYQALMRQVEQLVRVELPALARVCPAKAVRPFAARKLNRLFQRILARPTPGPGASAETMHALRKLCRRGRYVAEFFTPVLGSAVGQLARRLKEIADALGDLHDWDVALARIRRAGPASLGGLRRILARNRQDARREFLKAWKRLHRNPFVRSVDCVLVRAGKKGRDR
ncbi:MAG: CHAD domain-containing protein [Kiritimatiellae bacterium]|nr:CHAD domain-containing protein [Kiritimatiellia bacterium]